MSVVTLGQEVLNRIKMVKKKKEEKKTNTATQCKDWQAAIIFNLYFIFVLGFRYNLMKQNADGAAYTDRAQKKPVIFAFYFPLPINSLPNKSRLPKSAS